MVRAHRAHEEYKYMLIIKSKYKIGKRLGPAIFEQTQTQKFAVSEARTSMKRKPRGRGGSDYGRQLLEKQRIRFTYGLSERQLANYAEAAFATADPSASLHRALEMRLDSVVYRLGLAGTRRAARQMVSHRHVKVNGRRTTIPSHKVSVGDAIDVREGSRGSSLFAHMANVDSVRTPPPWLTFDPSALHAEVKTEPGFKATEVGLDYATLFEFYSR